MPFEIKTFGKISEQAGFGFQVFTHFERVEFFERSADPRQHGNLSAGKKFREPVVPGDRVMVPEFICDEIDIHFFCAVGSYDPTEKSAGKVSGRSEGMPLAKDLTS